MSNKNYNKIVANNKTIIDLTSDTVTPETLLSGRIAHSSDGSIIVGIRPNTISTEEEELSDDAGGDILDSSGNPILTDIGSVDKAEFVDTVNQLKQLVLQYEAVVDKYRAQENYYILDSRYKPVTDFPARI